ncbi:MAG: polysaccharide deacetylase family protein [Firmicutes bacterium]|nr:polysaccharide deacetylase family protein [Bacillota bacterium]
MSGTSLLLMGLAGAWTALAALSYTVGADIWYRGLGCGVIREGPGAGEQLALTFDDGPDPVWTARIASALEAFGARGTFFVLASGARRHPAVVRRLLEGGHEGALHGYDHRPLWLTGPRESCRRLFEAVAVLESILDGQRPRFFRPPWGHFNLAAARCARELGLRLVLWSHAPPDWRARTPAGELARHLREALRPGAIVDLHDAGPGDRPLVLAEVLPEALQLGRSRGLRFVPLSQLLHDDGGAAPRRARPIRQGEATHT